MYGIQPVDSANMSHVNLVVPPLGGEPGTFYHVSDVEGREKVERT